MVQRNNNMKTSEDTCIRTRFCKMNDSTTLSSGDRLQNIQIQIMNKQFIIAAYVKVQVLEITFQMSIGINIHLHTQYSHRINLHKQQYNKSSN